jgi:ribosomal protein S12 methylthiotransferase accessory factor
MEITFDGGKVISAHFRGFTLRTDQPVKGGGTESAPTPFDLYLASIGTCAGIYVKSFCDNRQIPTEGIKVIQHTVFSEETGLPIKLTIDIQVPPGFPEKYKASLINVAELCKVKKSIINPPVFEIKTSDL